jgi:hypothetical protein
VSTYVKIAVAMALLAGATMIAVAPPEHAPNKSEQISASPTSAAPLEMVGPNPTGLSGKDISPLTALANVFPPRHLGAFKL